MKIVVLGKGLMLANIVLGIKDAGGNIVGVFRYDHTTQNTIKTFLKDTFNPDYEYSLLKQFKIPEIKMKSANSEAFRRYLIKNNIDLIIVGTWKERLEKETFNIPTIGTVNVHPSLLPKYRGPNPYIQTILNGEKQSGVTLHLMNEKYDCGAILSQSKIEIKNSDTSKELRERTVTEARKLVRELLQNLDTQIITPISQCEKYATYFPNISGNEKMLDFTKQTSIEISRTIRALHPFLPCYITHKNKFFIVNPYDFKISDEISYSDAGEIIEKDPAHESLTIVCKDKYSIKFNKLKLYKAEFQTKNYIKNKINITS